MSLSRIAPITDSPLTPGEARALRYDASGTRAPIESASFFNRLSWSWVGEILDIGASRVLELDDLDVNSSADESAAIFRRVAPHVAPSASAPHATTAEALVNDKHVEEASYGDVDVEKDDAAARVTASDLGRALVAAFWRQFARNVCLAVLYALCLVLQPLFLRWIVSYVEDEDASEVEGYLYAAGLTVTALLQACVHHFFFFGGMNLGMKVRIACTCLVYQHALRIKTSALHDTTLGRIVNLVSSDVYKMEEGMPFFPYILTAPLIATVSLYLMWSEIGVAALLGVSVMLLLIPCQTFFSSKFGAIRKVTAKWTDLRTKTVSEMLHSAEVVKLYVWEEPIRRIVGDARAKEVASIMRAATLMAINQAIFFASSIVVAYVTFTSYLYLDDSHTLDAASVFSTVAYFNIIRLPLTLFLPMSVQRIAESRVSLSRIARFLSLERLPAVEDEHAGASDKDAQHAPDDDAPLVQLQDASVAWSTTSPPVLKNVSLSIPRGKLTVVVGPVGASKSTLLATILQETALRSGQLSFPYSELARGAGARPPVAFAAQSAWIIADSIRNNILFGRPFHRELYKKVISACQLETDLSHFNAGDMSFLGERGVNLSGGQLARVGLARAVYGRFVNPSEEQIFLLDDPLSAVDTIVGQKIFNRVLSNDRKSLLAGATRVLVTHQTQHLPRADLVIVLREGEVVASGTYEEVVAHVDVEALLHEHDNDEEEHRDSYTATISAGHDSAGAKQTAADADAKLLQQGSQANIIQKEQVTRGPIRWTLYRTFFGGAGLVPTVLVVLALITAQALQVLSDAFLSDWSSQSHDEQREARYINIYTGLMVAIIVMALARAIGCFRVVIRGSQQLHMRTFNAVLHASMRFFESNPVGRILNRFTKDQGVADELVPLVTFDFSQSLLFVLGALVVIFAVQPLVAVAFLPVGWIFVRVRSHYLVSSTAIRRIEGAARSPVYALFSSTLQGLMTVRAFPGAVERFANEFFQRVDVSTRAWMAFLTTTRWLGFRLDCLASCVVCCTAFLSVAFRDSTSAGNAGFALAYSLQLVALAQWLVRQSAELENHFSAVERIVEYSQLEPEGVRELPPSESPPADWPSHGSVVVRDLKMRYRPELDLVFRGLSFEIRAREKIGCVGRSGSGKSSLFATFFRLVEAEAGQIIVDGVDIQRGVGLARLRSSFSVIPQQPVLFSGTLRYNVDPFNEHDDHEIWSALEAVQLKRFVEALPKRLEHPVSEQGSMSVGESQLLCIARALLKPSKLLFVDEATANVDRETDRAVQQVIREQFKDRTVITIAHRLDTVMDSDRILVLDAGELVEFDTPQALLAMPDGLFARMASQSATLD